MRASGAKVTQVTGTEWLAIWMKGTKVQDFKSFGGRGAAGGIFDRDDFRVGGWLLVLQSCGLELVALFPLDPLGGIGRFPSQSESEPRHG
jgi:hypothetical protein